MRLTVRACRAPDAATDCRRNAVAWLQVLHRHGIANVTSAQQDWWTNPDTYALLLEDADSGEPMGGVRLQRFGNGIPLPLEVALRRVDPRALAVLAGCAPRGVGELCGLWRSPTVAGFGLGARLTAMGIALATQVDIATLFGLCDTRHVTDNLRLGFQIDTTLARRGRFEYPRPGLTAHVLRIPDARGLPNASPDVRAAIDGYRRAPGGRERIRVGPRSLDLTWRLRLSEGASRPRRASATKSRPPERLRKVGA